ncbi:hypothetical protein EJ110_NYTH51589 [Nymphaea thermarum]|nr:hypothetical protein EJ110_NYTH51589 [Nymphaea thermarum]
MVHILSFPLFFFFISRTRAFSKWVIEANIGCCDGCRDRVEKYLKRVQGVEYVDLYPEESKVVVAGDVDPTIVLGAVKKVRKEARMLTKDAPAKNLSALGDEYDNSKKKIIPADAVIPMKEASSEKAIVIYKHPNPSDGKEKVASETKTYGLNLSAYGLFGAGVYYKCAKTYKKLALGFLNWQRLRIVKIGSEIEEAELPTH